MKKMYDFLIIGGGASALFFLQVFKKYTAHLDASQKLSFLLVEAKEQLGKKILATGNGRCNILPAEVHEDYFQVSEKEAKAKEKLKALLNAVDYQDICKIFTEKSMVFLQEEDRLYPRSMQAASVLSLLASDLPADILLQTEVYQVKKDKNGFEVYLRPHVSGKTKVTVDFSQDIPSSVRAKKVIFAGGGLASLACHTSLLEEVCPFVRKEDLTERSPALAPIECKGIFKSLSGQRWRGKLSLKQNQKILASEQGEILFTDYGLSGIASMNLSLFLTEKEKAYELVLDLLPEYTLEELEKLLETVFQQEATEEAWLRIFSPKLFQALYLSFTKEDKVPSAVEMVKKLKKQSHAFAKHCKEWSFSVKQVRPYAYAQITKGGLKLSSLKKGISLAYAFCENFYVLGEALDVQARCGGNNLYFAWLSAYLLAKELFGGQTK